MNWISAAKILSFLGEKVLPFVKDNWKLLLIIALSMALFLSMRKDYRSLEAAFEASKTSYEQRLNALKELHDEEIRQREEALREYREELERINSRYEDSRAELERRRERDTEKIREQFDHEPEEVKQRIVETFGFEYVE